METGFFKWVWRFNAVVIAFAALAVIAVSVFIARELWQDYTRDKYAPEVVNIDTESNTLQDAFSYGYPVFDNDNNSIILPLLVSQTYGVSRAYASVSKNTGSNTINYLIINRDDDSSHWFFADHKQLITQVEIIKRPIDAEDDDKKVVARLYEIVTKDSNGDKRLSESDKKTLLITPPDRSNPTQIISGYDSIESFNHPDNNSFEILVHSDNADTLYTFSLGSLKQIGKFSFPALPTSR